MRRSPEIVILIVLLVIMVVGVLWYVADRRAKLHAAAARPVPTVATPAGMVELPDGKTVDFSSGHAVITDTPEDRAKMAKALKEMEEAARTVKFDPLPVPKKDPPTKASPDKP